MPARNDCIAPVFDSHRPRELRRYFSDLDYLFSRSSITDNLQKKFHATYFLRLDDQDLWETVPEFTDPAASFAQFTDAIFRLYPEADPSRRYSRTDLDALVAEFSSHHSPSRARFLEFYRTFLTISSFLCAKHRLSVFEQSRIFAHAVPSRIWYRALEHLHIKFPDVHPDDTYPLSDLRDAIDFVFLLPPSPTPAPPSPELPTPTPADSTIAALIDAVNELMRLVSSQQSSPVAPRLDSLPSPPRSALCSYCSDPTHFIARCPLVAADIRAGICRHNAEGKIVLPSGLFVPHRIPGPDLRARINAWHMENPVNCAPVLHSPDVVSAPRSHPTSSPTSHSSRAPDSAAPAPSPTRSIAPTLPTQSRIAVLEAELAALRSRVPRAPASHEPRVAPLSNYPAPSRPSLSRSTSQPHSTIAPQIQPVFAAEVRDFAAPAFPSTVPASFQHSIAPESLPTSPLDPQTSYSTQSCPPPSIFAAPQSCTSFCDDFESPPMQFCPEPPDRVAASPHRAQLSPTSPTSFAPPRSRVSVHEITESAPPRIDADLDLPHGLPPVPRVVAPDPGRFSTRVTPRSSP
ncbi:hypothetical protein C8F04DRAFT_1265497 [Mycena alexandri]|nr:hypothetical protein C8F04DRAFT_1265497 [Mycena alexandri]